MGAPTPDLVRRVDTAEPDPGPEGAARTASGTEAPGAAEKRSALDQVLQSTPFLRAEQLRNFLRYVCEMEFAGRAAELSEYLIGVEALGRPPGYSTADDSSVRRRAHALRQKLEEVYATELQTATIRIDLHKGSYAPRFIRVATAGTAVEQVSEMPGRDVPRAAASATVWRTAAFAAVAFTIGVLMTMAVYLRPTARSRAVDPALAEAWGPLARPGANVLICLATPPHFVILPYPEGPLPPLASSLPPLPQEPAIRDWYRAHYPLEPTETLAIHKTTGPVHLGDLNGLVTAVRTLDRLGVEFQIVPEKNMSLPALRGRNLLLFGNPEFSFAASKLLDRAVWTVAYDPATRQRVLRPRVPGSRGVPAYTPVRDSQGWLSDVFGLITVVQSEGSPDGDPLRTVIVSCTNDSGCQGAMEFFASGARMQALLERLRREGSPQFPPSYQVVVRCRVQSAQAISAEYESHVIVPAH